MRFIWVDAGNDADWGKLATHGINGAFYALSDPPADLRRRLTETKKRGMAAGLYSAWNWWGLDTSDGRAYAEATHERVVEVCEGLAGVSNSYPKVQLDNEDHRPDVILAMLRRWRELQPKRDTSWTLESGQGGWMTVEFTAEVVRLRVRVVPQSYTGPMARVESDFTLRDLLRRAYPESSISLFYDAAALGVNWDGFAFTMGRLP